MAVPAIPDAGKPWLTWAQGVDAEARKVADKVSVADIADPNSTGGAALRAALGSADPLLSDFVYAADGSGNLLSYKEDGVSIVLTYNADGTVATSKRGTAAAKTFTYSGGNLAGVA